MSIRNPGATRVYMVGDENSVQNLPKPASRSLGVIPEAAAVLETLVQAVQSGWTALWEC